MVPEWCGEMRRNARFSASSVITPSFGGESPGLTAKVSSEAWCRNAAMVGFVKTDLFYDLPEQPSHHQVASGAALASERYPGRLSASRERSGRQAFPPVIALRLPVAQSPQFMTLVLL